MPTTRRLAAVSGVLLAAALVAGCVAQEPSPEVAAQPGLTPVAESERVVSDRWGVRVQGRLRNDSDQMRSGALEVTLLDEGGRVVGTYGALVGGVKPGEEATYTAVGGDRPDAWGRISVRVTGQFVHQPRPLAAG
jgi:hypothetical protein